MNFKETTGKSIAQAFDEFHRDNPKVYELFKSYALRAIDKGKKKASAKMLINAIRWEHYLETVTDDEYRINDAFTAYYARLFIRDFPDYDYLFELRAIRTKDDTIRMGNAEIKHDKDGQIVIF